LVRIVCRLGAFVLLPPQDASTENIVDDLGAALEDDPRVVDVSRPELRSRFGHEDVFYKGTDDGQPVDAEALLHGAHYHSLHLSNPILFELHVPSKNQPTRFGPETRCPQD
jgi:hypothetical protein